MSAPTKATGVQFKVHIVGDVTGKVWPGEFRAKTNLTFADKLAADRFRRELLGDAGGVPDQEAAAAARIISQLSVRLTEYPEWWKAMKGGLDVEDFNILMELWEKVSDIEKDHLKRLEAEGAAAQEALRKEAK
jgi:hypothetical protein